MYEKWKYKVINLYCFGTFKVDKLIFIAIQRLLEINKCLLTKDDLRQKYYFLDDIES